MSNGAKFAQQMLGGLMAIGGVMHFTRDVHVWQSPLLDALAASGFLWAEIGVVNLIAGAALVADRFAPLAAAALVPITSNIFLFHLWRHDLFGLTIGIPVAVLNAIVVFNYRDVYAPLLARAGAPSSIEHSESPR